MEIPSELIHENPKSFVIAGDMGDVVYHLLFIKKLGAKKYHIDPWGGANYIRDGYIRCGDGNPGKFNLKKALFLLPLLKAQSYLDDVDLYTGEPSHAWKQYDVNASEYHKDELGTRNLTFFHAKKYRLDIKNLNEPWIEVGDEFKLDPKKDMVISRSMRYRGNDNFYYFNKDAINERGIFVGLYEEFQDFVQRFGCTNVPYIQTDTALDLAQVINGCNTFIGNGSMPAALAIGLGLNVEYEFCPFASHYLFERSNLRIF